MLWRLPVQRQHRLIYQHLLPEDVWQKGGADAARSSNGDLMPRPGLTVVPGCSGDCFAVSEMERIMKEGMSFPAISVAMCADLTKTDGGDGPDFLQIAEPTTNRVADMFPNPHFLPVRLRRFAPPPFADTAHGGGILGGQPYDPAYDPSDTEVKQSPVGASRALQQCYGTTKTLVDFNGADQAGLGACPYGLDKNACGTSFLHKDHFLDDPVGSVGTLDDAAPSNLGAPIFNGWPKWTSTTHQQAYYTWLKRAYKGGLRLTTMLAVTNTALCLGNKRLKDTDATTQDPGTICGDSMKQIDVQIKAARDFAQWVADHDGGWFTIVEDPVKARQTIAEGKLAVVLGIEVDHLFNCKFPMDSDQVTLFQTGVFPEQTTWDGIIDHATFSKTDLTPECNPTAIQAALDHYYAEGVRHVFPVHNFDNAYGGAAAWLNNIDFGQRASAAHWWHTENCPDEYGRKVTVASVPNILSWWSRLLKYFVGQEMAVIDDHVRNQQTTSCNQFGLLPLGKVLIEGMMDRGMIIDVDHMSNKAINDTLVMAKTRAKPYPLVASHVLAYDSVRNVKAPRAHAHQGAARGHQGRRGHDCRHA